MRSRLRCLLAGLLTAGLCATGLAQAPDDTRLAAQALAPGGELRVGINLGNPVLAALAAGATEPTGVSVDIAREAARRLGVGLRLRTFTSAGNTVATLVRAENSQSVVDVFMRTHQDVAAGVRQQLEFDAGRYPGVRVLPGRFMVINQAIGVPNNRPHPAAVSGFLRQLVNELKASGFILEALKRHGIAGAAVAD